MDKDTMCKIVKTIRKNIGYNATIMAELMGVTFHEINKVEKLSDKATLGLIYNYADTLIGMLREEEDYISMIYVPILVEIQYCIETKGEGCNEK